MSKKVAIIGGGAAGLVAAISAARAGADVVLVEAQERVGKKLLVTGNGRCNFSNADIYTGAYNCPAFVGDVLTKWGSEEVRRFFSELGLLHTADIEGRFYPSTNIANSVLDVLRLECVHLGVKEHCNFDVIDVRPRINPQESQPPFTLVAQSGTWVNADAVVLATGSNFSLVSFLGHTKRKSTPGLCSLRTSIDKVRGFSGIRVRCAASLVEDGTVIAREEGELLFRDYGVSGVMVFDLSRFAHQGQRLIIDFFPEYDYEELLEMLTKRSDDLAWRATERFLDGMLHPRIAASLLKANGKDPERLTRALKEFRLDVLGLGDPRQAQVTCGGVNLDEVDSKTLASKRVPGLYIAGETLDVDGRCGGYNLHWAWASGLVAGNSAALSLPLVQSLF